MDDKYSTFEAKFPFLCEKCTADKDDANEDEKEPKPRMNRIQFQKMNKGIHPNQIFNDKLYLGDKNSAISEQVMKDLKITHVINCTPSPPDYVQTFNTRGYIQNIFEKHKQLNIKYMRIPIDDSDIENIKSHFLNAIQFLHQALDNDNHRILVHCFAGKSRSSTIIIAYLMHAKGMGYDEAFKFVKQKRDIIQPNKGFVQQLKIFEMELAKKTPDNPVSN